MKLKDASDEFKAIFTKHYKSLKRKGLSEPSLSSMAKQYAKLDLRVDNLVNHNDGTQEALSKRIFA